MIPYRSRCLLAAVVFIAGAGTPMYAADDVGPPPPNAVRVHRDVAIRHAIAAQTTTLAIAQNSTRLHRPRCESKKKGTIIGAAIGGVAGAVFATYVNHEAGGVPGAANGANRFLAYWTLGGAGGGAVVGYALCH